MVVKREKCDVVSLMERVRGRLEVTSHSIYFYSDPGERKEGRSCELESVCGVNTAKML